MRSDHTRRLQHSLAVGSISQVEAVGQSLAGIAPTATPAMVVPLVLLSSGRSAWLAFLVATFGVLCLARQINLFARRTASAGSLYSYIRRSLGLRPSIISGWALLIAYISTGSAAAAGFGVYALPLLHVSAFPLRIVIPVTVTSVVFITSVLAYRDVRLSARVMLGVEACSIVLLLLLFVLPGSWSIWQVDWKQLTLTEETPRHVGSGLTLAIFSLVGFESATALGEEVDSPLTSIPRAVWITALISGVLFSIAAYAEHIGFGGNIAALSNNAAPLQILARLKGLPVLVPGLEVGAASSFFACILACCTAAARMMFQMSRDGHIHRAYGSAHVRHKTPHLAIALCGCVVLMPVLALTLLNVGLLDIYNWLGTLATFGFLTGYLMLLIASIVLLLRERRFSAPSLLTVSGAGGVIFLAIWGSLSGATQGAYARLPLIYAMLLFLGIGISIFSRGSR